MEGEGGDKRAFGRGRTGLSGVRAQVAWWSGHVASGATSGRWTTGRDASGYWQHGQALIRATVVRIYHVLIVGESGLEVHGFK